MRKFGFEMGIVLEPSLGARGPENLVVSALGKASDILRVQVPSS